MSVENNIEQNSIKDEKAPVNKKYSSPTIRLILTLREPDEESCSVFDYNKLIAEEVSNIELLFIYRVIWVFSFSITKKMAQYSNLLRGNVTRRTLLLNTNREHRFVTRRKWCIYQHLFVLCIPQNRWDAILRDGLKFRYTFVHKFDRALYSYTTVLTGCKFHAKLCTISVRSFNNEVRHFSQVLITVRNFFLCFVKYRRIRSEFVFHALSMQILSC